MSEQEELSPETSLFRLPLQPMQMDVTPDMASDWLSHRNHPLNRPQSKRVSARYQRDMENGLWIETPQGYSFDTQGYLIDGQHRLKAQANGNITLKNVWVFPDQLREAFGVFDSGYKRAPAHMLNVSYAAPTAAALRHLVSASTRDRWTLARYNAITTAEILKAKREWPEAQWYSREAYNVWRATGIPQAPHQAILAMAARTSHVGKIRDWLAGLESGANLQPRDPRLTLRQRYISNYRVQATMTKRDLDWRQIMKAWNAYATDQPLNMLRVLSSDPMPDLVDFDWKNEDQ